MAPDEVTLVSWLRSPGDAVEAGDAIAVIETSKAEMEVESESAGTLGPHLYPAGAAIDPGTTITYVLDPGEEAAGAQQAAGPTGAPQARQPGASPQPTAQQPPAAHPPAPTGTAGVARAPHSTSPRARRIAAQAAAAAVVESKVTEPAPAAAVSQPAPPHEAAAAPGEDRRREGTRAAIARTVSRSWAEVPHFSVSRELRAGDLIGTATQWRAVLPRLTVTDLLLRVLALAMVDAVGSTGVDLGLAVATDAGVVIPVIQRVPELGLPDLVNARVAAVARARAGRMHIDDAAVPATTLSNMGALGVDHFTGVIPHGSTSLVTVGRAAQRPVVTDGELTVATTMWVTVNLDHRVYDGIHGANLLDRLAVIVSAPALFLGGGAPLAPASVPTSSDKGANR
jgi:pyruvate dehydrogenase E2 component (dihydrolipoamide acetyltransferase)